MDTTHSPRFSANDLSSKVTSHIEELAQATDAALLSEEMTRYLDTFANFHQYSPHNVWLILMARPSASAVAGYHRWRELNRYVCKGEHGIPILAPMFKKETNGHGEEEQSLIGFKVVYVFDLSQTEGEPLPDPPNWKSPEKNEELQGRLTIFAESKGISVTVKSLACEIQGVSKGGLIELDPSAGTKTLIHEIAHELMHKNGHIALQRSVKELEAEAVAYVVGKHLGLDGLSSPSYIALHGADSEMILGHMERIRTTATEIIKAVE